MTLENRDDAICVIAGKVGSMFNEPHDNTYGIHMYARFIFNTEIPICIKFNRI